MADEQLASINGYYQFTAFGYSEHFFNFIELPSSEQHEYFSQRREGSKRMNRVLTEYRSLAFKKLDFVLQRRFCAIAYPTVQVMLHESSRIFSMLDKIRRKILVLSSFWYDPNLSFVCSYLVLHRLSDVVVFVVTKISEIRDGPFSPADFSKFVFQNHVKDTWFYPRSFSEIPKNLLQKPHLEVIHLWSPNQPTMLTENSNFEKLMDILSTLPKLSQLVIDEFDVPKDWEKLFLQKLANLKLEACYFTVVSGSIFYINVPKLYEIYQKFSSIKIHINMYRNGANIPVFGKYFVLEMEEEIPGQEDRYEPNLDKGRMFIQCSQKQLYYGLRQDSQCHSPDSDEYVKIC